jgi:hypothetical protein
MNRRVCAAICVNTRVAGGAARAHATMGCCASAPPPPPCDNTFRRRRLSQPARDGLEGLVIPPPLLISFLRRAREYSTRSLRRAPATPNDKERR